MPISVTIPARQPEIKKQEVPAFEFTFKNQSQIKEGDTVTVYLSENAPVYEDDGSYIIYSYYALEVRKEYEHEYRKRENIQTP